MKIVFKAQHIQPTDSKSQFSDLGYQKTDKSTQNWHRFSDLSFNFILRVHTL